MSDITKKALEAKILLESGNYALIGAKLDEIIELDKPKKRGRKSKLDLTLEKLGYTREQMQKFWDDALEVNWKIQAIAKCGKDWRDLNEYQLTGLVNLKEKTLAQLAEKEAKENAELEKKKKAEAEKKYYEEHFEEIMLRKLQNHEELTQREYGRLAYEYEVWYKYNDRLRHQMSKSVVFEISGHYFLINFYEDVSDMGEHYYPDYLVEVSFDKKTETYTKLEV